MYRYFVYRRPRNTDDLIDVATVYECVDNVRDETPRQRPPAPKCRYCPGYHYNANCPELQDKRRAGNVNGVNRGSVPNEPAAHPHE